MGRFSNWPAVCAGGSTQTFLLGSSFTTTAGGCVNDHNWSLQMYLKTNKNITYLWGKSPCYEIHSMLQITEQLLRVLSKSMTKTVSCMFVFINALRRHNDQPHPAILVEKDKFLHRITVALRVSWKIFPYKVLCKGRDLNPHSVRPRSPLTKGAPTLTKLDWLKKGHKYKTDLEQMKTNKMLDKFSSICMDKKINCALALLAPTCIR